MQFKDVVGQDAVKKHMVEMVQQNRLSHALLFLGKEGSGALPLAIAFARYLVCEKNRKDPGASLFGEAIEPARPADDSCGSCPACTRAAALAHPDIHFSYPVITKKPGSPPLSADFISEWRSFIQHYPYGNIYDWLQSIGAENKQGNITAHECNDIIRKLSLKSFESGYKILVLWMPEYLGKEGNKLLKLIEEPPPDTLFILVAENESEVLGTILSRCQVVRIPAIDDEAIALSLAERNQAAPETARRLARISEGNYREALNLLQHQDEDFHNLLRDWLNATLKNQAGAQVKTIEEISRLGRENQKQFLRYFTHLLEQALRLQLLDGAARQQLLEAMTEQEQDFAGRLNRAANLAQQEAIITELDKAAYFVERNANAKILFHALTIKIFHIVRHQVVVAG